MSKRWQGDDRQFALSEGSFGVSLLRQAAHRVSGLSPAMQGRPATPALSKVAGEAFDRLLGHVYALPKEQQVEACVMIAHGMIMEHLRLASRMPRA